MVAGSMGEVFVCGAYLLDMPTAFVYVHTSEGIVVASDGRVKTGDDISTDDAQKIFFIPGQKLVYGTMGVATLTIGGKTDMIDVQREIDKRVFRVGTHQHISFDAYAKALCSSAFLRIKNASKDGELDDKFEEDEEMRAGGDPGYCFGRIFFWGFHYGSAHMELRLVHDNQIPRMVSVSKQANRTWNVYGSIKVYDALRDRENHAFDEYRIDAMKKDHGITKAEGIEIAQRYIKACQTPQALVLDPKYCPGIGGNAQIAIVAPDGMPYWEEGYSPKQPQDWTEDFRAKYIKPKVEA